MVHGVRVPARVIEAPETITVADIDAENNAEVRRVMLERFGEARDIEESGGKCIDQSFDTKGNVRQLWRKDIPGDEPIVMYRCINSSVEPDGTRKIYRLRVPPTIRTAREAFDWTFNLQGQNYDLVLET
jgi:hypothetical protein